MGACSHLGVAVADLTEDLDYSCTAVPYVSKMYEYDSGTVLVTLSPPKLYQAKRADAEVQAEDLFVLET